jgi:hypothetical protein
MRRSLVLVDETAAHPFRRSLPPHVRAALAQPIPHREPESRLDLVRQFLLAYCACFLAVSLYIW